MGLITDNELLKERLVDNLIQGIPSIEKTVFDEIMNFLDSFEGVGGNFNIGTLTAEKLTEIEARINQILIRGGYPAKVQTFIQDFGKVTINTDLLLNANGFDTRPVQLSDMERKWKKLTADTLIDSGLREDFKRPILKILDDAISYGDGIGSVRQTLQDYVIGNKDKSGKLKSYLTQTARDSVSQMQGQQMQSVANAVGYEGIRYVGGLLKDSRGQCSHWIQDLKGFIPKENLQAEITLAYKNQTAKLVEGPHKWGGMMPNTTVDNFMVKRGGFNCTHTAMPKRKR